MKQVNPDRELLRRYIRLVRPVFEVYEQADAPPHRQWAVYDKRDRVLRAFSSKSEARAAKRKAVAERALRTAWTGIFRGAPFPAKGPAPYEGGPVDEYLCREWTYAVYAAVVSTRNQHRN